MEDASCSGSTPFKRLVDHQSRDLSLHQDRHVSRGAFGQSSFRSSPLHPAQGQQDAFGAFMGSASALPGFESDATARLTPSLPFAQVGPPHGAPAHPSFSSSPMQMQTPAPASSASNWAADFNRFAAQQQQQQQQQRAPAPALTPAARQMSHSPAAQTSFQPAFAQQPNFASAFGQSVFSPPAGAVAAPDFDQEMSRWMSAHGAGNMQDVDAAMDQIARELEESEAVAAAIEASRQTHDETLEIGTLSIETGEMQHELATIVGTKEDFQQQLEPEQLHEPEPELEKEEPADTLNNNKSAVAEAAEKLLDAVKHESGEKWQNSIFLSLMRDFRDGRKDIVGDEIRSTSGGTGETTPAVQPVAT
ncbi:hypothetical protein BBK36DRAFT_1159114 [Trichoderma citrinoviride]|uniref:Peroxin 20 n=1 Tax=Trichoderma citrinoviride TaxID=58853 RepID=A0A2T4BD27_9HYPO|nr:hypothetical protein BBK36DRAFT_1159114 [Trichoderma citrinoviride]PTB67178.1 hypothetical protein BBK36DRAFT_1159114 [Trichoderma citrinoviride]